MTNLKLRYSQKRSVSQSNRCEGCQSHFTARSRRTIEQSHFERPPLTNTPPTLPHGGSQPVEGTQADPGTGSGQVVVVVVGEGRIRLVVEGSKVLGRIKVSGIPSVGADKGYALERLTGWMQPYRGCAILPGTLALELSFRHAFADSSFK